MKKFKLRKMQQMPFKRLDKLLLILLFFLVKNTSVAQDFSTLTMQEESDYIRMVCYGDLLMFSSFMSIEEYEVLLKNSSRVFRIDTISSSGFKDVNFLKVSFQNRNTLNELYNDLEKQGNYVRRNQYLQGAEYFVYPCLSNHEYVFASSHFGLYKLKGFRVNDFYKFYADCFNTGDCFLDQEIKAKRGDLSDKKIIKSLSVEGLDLWGLYKIHFKGKKPYSKK